MVTYAVNISNVQEVAGEMGIIAGKIQTMVDELNNQQNLNLAEWSGQARDAYSRDQVIWNAAAKDMSAQATAAQNALGSITDAYANAEYQGLGLWSSS
jgi:WXG100 family type VII secretion target